MGKGWHCHLQVKFLREWNCHVKLRMSKITHVLWSSAASQPDVPGSIAAIATMALCVPKLETSGLPGSYTHLGSSSAHLVTCLDCSVVKHGTEGKGASRP